VEGFNPGHDVCRLLLNTALLRLEQKGRRLRNFEFLLEGPPQECPLEDRPEAIFLELDDGALQRKLEAARAYPELTDEVNQTFATYGWEPFRVECLRPVRYGMEIADRFQHPPYYESYGEKQVTAGIYREVIRFWEHMAPLAASLGRVSCAGA
ncbi:MAG TPA: hypothetical protein VE078_17365, partial [Thermoanaerobaculia bacterium]|nr:hypothetical protein [Thermoanaerobaculia bacterium]